jgi:DNA-binding response OmpR family regulator
LIKNILLVEDDLKIHNLIIDFVEEEGYRIKSVYNGMDAVNQIKTTQFDLIILDLVLPDYNGEELIEFFKKNSTAPIFIITSKDDETSLAVCLGIGADEYMTKPFSRIEFLARIKKVFRQNCQREDKEVIIKKVGPYEINYCSYEVFKDNNNLNLTAKEFQILTFLLSNTKHVFSKKEIFYKVWPKQLEFYDNLINVHMRRLRNKLNKKGSKQSFIITVFGFGYRINESLMTNHDETLM